MSGRGAGGFPLPPLSPGGGAVAAALGAPPPPAGPGMLPGPALRGPGPAGGVGGPGAAAFRPMGPAGPAAQYQVSREDGRPSLVTGRLSSGLSASCHRVG
uniref:SWI/SNF related BAF chromatin remodeling complex subunit D2 n=2 Tax=Cercopithecinae TaxID=9528 RepID=A0A2K5NTE3_CERAT